MMKDPHPINIRMLDHVVVRANDMERMVGFYTEVLGCRIERHAEKFGLVQLRAGNSLIDIVDVDGQLGRAAGGPPDGTAPNMDHFCVQVEPWDEAAILSHLKAHGVEVGEVGNRYGALGTGPSVYLEDPEGNTVELKGPPAT